MQIQLVRKLANHLDGIDVTAYRQGDVIDLPRREAELLIAEQWAVACYDPASREVLNLSATPQLAIAADRLARRSLDQMRRFREEMAMKRFEEQERRRAEDRIREELHDEHATTIHGKAPRRYCGAMPEPESWLRGPIEGIAPLLQPVAHSLFQAREDVAAALSRVPLAHLWVTPHGAASIGFHVRHLCGSLDRLLSYARGEALTPAQLAYLETESAPGTPPADAASLIALVDEAVQRALRQLRGTSVATLTDARAVGRQRLPSTVIGLLVHAAEHTTRHAGQIITTSKLLPLFPL